MKLKIKVKVLTEGCMPVVLPQGDWIDLRAAENVELKAPQSETLKTKSVNGVEEKYRNVSFSSKLVKLGVAMSLPEGFEAELKGRSSLTRRHNVFMTCSGVIDNSYKGNSDEWLINLTAIGDCFIEKGSRIAQFRIVPNQKATMWQKIKWLLSSGVELVQVDDLGDNNRGGLGSTGIK